MVYHRKYQHWGMDKAGICLKCGGPATVTWEYVSTSGEEKKITGIQCPKCGELEQEDILFYEDMEEGELGEEEEKEVKEE